MAKTEIRKMLKGFRDNWINAFFKLKYDKNLSDKENVELFRNWAWSTNWRDIKDKL